MTKSGPRKTSRSPDRRLKANEIEVRETRLTKADFDAIPEDERVLFFMSGQIYNEIGILTAVLIQALQTNKQGRPKAIRETAVGTTYLMARLLCNRIYEGWDRVGREKSKLLFELLWQELPALERDVIGPEVEAARARLHKYFSNDDALLKIARRKLASHIDRATFVGAYNLLPLDFPLHDFHTGKMGTTFYGGADSLAAIAPSVLVGTDDLLEGNQQMLADVLAVGSDLRTVIDGYMVAFMISRFGPDVLAERGEILRGLPSATALRFHYFFAVPSRLVRDSAIDGGKT